LIAFMLTLLGSRFVYAPGSQVALDDLLLPESSMRPLAGVPTVDVLTLLQEGRVIYDGQFMSVGSWSDMLAEPGAAERQSEHAILLVKADARVSLQAFLRIADLAREAGYARVQIAERPRSTEGNGAVLVAPEPEPRFQ